MHARGTTLLNAVRRLFAAAMGACLLAGCHGGNEGAEEEMHAAHSVPSGMPLPEAAGAEATGPRAVLWLTPDHTVDRTAVENDNGRALSSVITRDARVVLQRNARNETRNRYFVRERGVYTVYLQAFVGGSYRLISNVVFYKL